MNRKILTAIIALIALVVGYYLISPLFLDKESDDQDPLAKTEQSAEQNSSDSELSEDGMMEELEKEPEMDEMKTAEPAIVKMELEKMSPEGRKQYEEDMKVDRAAIPMVNEKIEMPVATAPAKESQAPTAEKPAVVAPAGPRKISSGGFKPNLHDVSGEAILIENNGDYVVRFQNFDSLIGPNTRVYLSKNKSNDDFIDLGPLKANRGNINYKVPAGKNPEDYPYVLVWCKPFAVLFSYAQLSK